MSLDPTKRDAIHDDLLRLNGVMALLVRVYAGEFSSEEQPDGSELCVSIQWAAKVAARARNLCGHESGTGGALFDEVAHAAALLNALDTMAWYCELKIPFGDEVMLGYLDAVDDCVARALVLMGPDSAPPSLLVRMQAEGALPSTSAPDAPAVPIAAEEKPRKRRQASREEVPA